MRIIIVPPKVWMLLSGADQMRRECPTQYEDMLSVKADPHSVVVEQINTDLHRTFPNNIYFKSTSDPKGLQQPLFNVLLAFAHANPQIGYCQVLAVIHLRKENPKQMQQQMKQQQ